jgi:hypothetical protein
MYLFKQGSYKEWGARTFPGRSILFHLYYGVKIPGFPGFFSNEVLSTG